MKKAVYAALFAGCLSLSLGAADYSIGISGSERGINGFALSVGNYYRVPQREIMVIERSVPRDEMSVVYLLANRAHLSAQHVADLRMHGDSWWDITLRLGLDPYSLYVVDSDRHSGPPYGKAYGYYKEGKKHRLRDEEIVELANVRFLSKYHRVSVDDVIDRRRGGEQYDRIDEHYRGKKQNREERGESRGNKRDRGHGQGNNR